MKTLKLDQFEKFECNISQLEEIRGGERVYTGKGLNGAGGCVEDYCYDDGFIIYYVCEC